MDVLLISALMVVLLLLQGFFSGSEIALVHADRLRLHHLAVHGHHGAALVLKMFRKPEILLGTTLVGTNISVVMLTTLGTILMIRFFGEYGDLYAFLIFSPLFLIFGEVVPKSVYQQKADFLSPRIVFPLQFFSWIFYPVVFLFSWVVRLLANLAGVSIAARDLFTNREQIRTVIEMAEQGADIDVFDRDRILKVTNFASTTVGQVMIPINEMTLLSSDKSTQEAIHLARQQAHFRLPVYENEHNQIIGVVNLSIWELMDPKLREKSLSNLIKPAFYVTAHQLLDELLTELQHRHDHMAVVVDEFGSAIGMITIERLLEEVIGEVINVGYASETYLPRSKHHIEKCNEDEFLMDGRVPITEASALLKVELPSVKAHTIGGMVIANLRHIPKVGECIIQAGYQFSVHEVSERQIKKIRVVRVNK